jgi:murein DD-endopeptidase MepM/ murein hydrolase activator NlpD
MPRRLLPLAVIGTALAAPSSALAQSGTGGATPTPRLRATTFRVAPGSVVQGSAVKFAWRIDGPVRKATARVALLPADGGAAVWVRLGVRAIGTRATRTWTPALAPGRYVARLHARGPHGARLRRTARAAGRVTLEITAPAAEPVPTPAAVTPGIFPVQGAYDFGGDDARFGAGRRGHIHQGQDIIAAEGTPVVTPVAGLVHWRAYQASGAGHYVVVRGDDGRDYVFMHMQDGSVVAEKGRRVAAGERLGNVGTTGDSDGAHLHFEIWPDGWYAGEGSQPIDPLPDLLGWASAA